MEEIFYGRDRRNFLDDETRYSLVDEPAELEKKGVPVLPNEVFSHSYGFIGRSVRLK